jgi:hypothetical protein
LGGHLDLGDQVVRSGIVRKEANMLKWVGNLVGLVA